MLSVSDKEGIVKLAKGLREHGFKIISSGGTASHLEENGIKVQKVSEITGFPEILDGRVKTLHPKIHGGILHEEEKHKQDIEEHGLPNLDMVVVNLYPFEKVTKREHDLKEAIKNIDIGGVALLRAAAKNHDRVTVVTGKEDYDLVLDELASKDGVITKKVRKDLALKAFKKTMKYDAAISEYLHKEFSGELFPDTINVIGKKIKDLRYGDNPGQKAVFYKRGDVNESSVTKAEQLHGKQLSYNNILDLEAALDIVKEFEEPAVAAIKHTNPTGVATKPKIHDAYQKVYECDPKSIFGGLIGSNRKVTAEMAEKMNEIFLEAVIAPQYEQEALEILKESKNLRIMELPGWKTDGKNLAHHSVTEGLLVQEKVYHKVDRDDLKIKSSRKPTEEELEAMLFGWKVVKHVKSNAIVFSKKDHTVGIGAGQMSRVDSVKVAKMKAYLEIDGAIMASDAFFPFRDGIDQAADAGIKGVIQPGGSIRDEETIKAAEENGLSMVFTGQRVFKH